jgi:hypothetical protein
VRRTRWIGVGMAAAAAVLVLLLWPKREETSEELIQRKVLQMAAFAEEKNLGAIMEHISADFRGTQMVGSREELKQLLAVQILGGQWVRVFVRDMEVTITSPTEAAFRGKFIFGRSAAESLERLVAESRIQAYQVDAQLRKEADGEWRFYSGGYRPIPPGELF